MSDHQTYRQNARSQTEPIELDVNALDLNGIVRPGDTLEWGQGTAEPRALTSALVGQRYELSNRGADRLSIFLGVLKGRTLLPEYTDTFRYFGLGGLGETSFLSRAGALEVLPIRLSTVSSLFRAGTLHADVVFVQLSEPDTDGMCSTGFIGDHIRDSMLHARIVIGEINRQVPFTYGDTLVPLSDLDYLVRTDTEPVRWPAGKRSATSDQIASMIAELIPDGATLQLGIGAIPEALCDALRDKRDLGIHSGMIGDTVVDLVEAGVITNALKPIDRGITVTGLIFGTERSAAWADHNPALAVKSLDYTHSAATLAQLPDLYAVNSAIEIDATGQINAEIMGDAYAGGIGGQLDFAQAAISSERGRSIIALPSTAAGGTVSRIVPRLAGGVVTTPRSNADLFVTEHGVADLRGASIEQRIARMALIAHPDHREAILAEGQFRR